MELVDDEEVETMIALYCGKHKNSPIHLFAELAGVEKNEDLTAYGEEHGAQEPCIVSSILYVDSESTIRAINIDLNVVPDIDVVGNDGYDSSDPYNQEVDSDSDPDIDEVPDDIDDEDMNDEGNINASSVGNQIRHIVIHNNPGPHKSLIDPSAAYVAKFSEYSKILPAHWLAENEFPVLPDLSIWEVPPTTFKLVPDKELLNQMEAGHVFIEDVRDIIVANHQMARSMNVEVYSQRLEMFQVMETIGHRPGIPPRSYGVDLRNRRCDCRRFQTLHYPCAHVVAACAKVSLNVEKFVDDVYTLESTLRV
ncbi:hypothetical protein GOBAR_AA04659 [Gossypium barbadense]|uniref:SWIM-type domain-containing protein n=1 Tax=Gossypium barbadense TaxID=3634 RepID=A0A2P5YK30_GOSBA|nr:hypothetical protein GOBAR_AA04659 [Gossypium barbadense]